MPGLDFQCASHLLNSLIHLIDSKVCAGEFDVSDRFLRTQVNERLQGTDCGRVVAGCNLLAGSFQVKARCLRAVGQADDGLVPGFPILSGFGEDMNQQLMLNQTKNGAGMVDKLHFVHLLIAIVLVALVDLLVSFYLHLLPFYR